MCKSGFYGNGTYCAMSNTCLVNNGGCHFKAKCASTGPGKNNCTCDELYGGDGYTCYSSIAEEVKSHPNLTHLAQLMRNIDDNDNILSWLDSNYTFFAPTDDVMNKLLLEGDTGYWRNENNILTLLRFHTLTKEYNVDNLKQLSKYYSKFDTLFDGYSLSIAVKSDGVFILTNLADQAKIIEPDIPALNGFIHVIDKVLEPFLPDADLPDLEEFFTSNSQYSLFGQQLDQKDLLQFLEDMDEYTLFVPTNDVLWSINRTITKRFLQYYILPKIYLTAAFEDNQMITTVLGTDHRLHITFIDNKMFVNNVPIEDSNHLTVGGVVHGLSGILHPVINRCDQTYTNQTFGACVSCQQNFYPCPYNFKSRIPPVIMKNACTFTDIISGLNMIGCHTLCYYQKVTLECCNGYYGDKCNECPGGPEISCSGHGVCSDGIDGTGLCQCEDSFTGFKCHKCDVGLTGPGCNISINSCNYLNGNCSQHAVCQKVEGSVTCQCKPGFIGDGHTCQSPCDVHKNICDSHALCKYDSTNHSLSCECFEGYHGNGSWCKEIVNQCAVGNGGCSLYAQCMFEPPATTSLEDGMVNCECLKGYIGNGTLCNKDILNTLSQLPQVSNFYQAVKSVENTNLTKLLSNREGKITLFTPVNKVDDTKPTKDIDIQSLNYSTEDIRKYIVDFEAIYINTTLILTNNSYIPSLAGDILHITYNDRQFYVNGNRILEKNIPTLNGFIHLIEPPTSTVQLPVNTDNTITSPTDLSVIIGPVVAVVIVLIIVIVVIVYYKRAKSTGFLNFMKRYKKDIDDSFTHLHGSSEDDSEPDPLQQPGNINYNPLYQSQVEEEFDN